MADLDQTLPLADLPGGERFRLLRRIGAGGMGVVYEALDGQRGGKVALKTLRDLDADGIYYLKREFRALSDVVHPNLVQLHELVSLGDRWFFTMELVQGVDLLSYVREGSTLRVLPSGVPFLPPDPARLAAALRQLLAGVTALHAAGKLHRDIKPSNALVDREGRVVLLDFGLVTDLTLTRLYQTVEPKLVGTPYYLAPEQAACEPLTPAADLYSVGALLYEALAGTPPFSGGLLQILTDKRSRDPLPPSAVAGVMDPALEALCMELLRRDPADRPSAAEVLRRLGGAPASRDRTPAQPPASAAPRAGAPWVGRHEQLEALTAALRTVEQGRPAVVFAHGPSGFGKTALVQRFLDALAERPDVVVLPGRCYERELVPYRALDSLVDALARHLMAAPPHEAEAILPRDTQALCRLFPVLRRAEVFAAGGRKPLAAASDPHEERRRAFGALRELLGRLGARKTLVLAIDDLQWGDADSALLLQALLAPPDAPAALFLFSYRSEDRELSPCLLALRGAPGEGASGAVGRSTSTPERLGGAEAAHFEVPVGPLPPELARALALALLDPGVRERAACAEAIARECGGSPFFLRALVEHVHAAAEAGDALAVAPAGLTLEHVLKTRLARLTPAARRLLQVLAVAARPLPRATALHVAGLATADEQALGLLRGGHLVRARGGADELEIAHDRIRAAAAADLPAAEVTEIHRRLARALATREDVDPELLADHLEGAGDPTGAALEAARAAARADEALAFERAARLYRRALGLAAEGDVDRRALETRLGDALANLGRGAEAATAYLEAAQTADAAASLELRRRAAEQLLRVGHLDEGLQALQAVLASIGAALAPSPRRAWLSLLGRRARIRLRGLRFRRRDVGQVAPHDLTRLDVFWSVSTALAIVDYVRATDFQTRHLLLALKLGEPYRIGRALAAEAAYSALPGPRTDRRTRALVTAAQSIADEVDEPFARGWATLAAGMAAYFQGRFQDARSLCERAEEVFRGCTGVWWEVGSARLFSLWSLFYLGEVAELGRRLPAYLAEAEARGDQYTATNFRTSILNWHWLFERDDPDAAIAEIDTAMRRWSRAGFHTQHLWHMIAVCNASLYRGDPAAARARLDRDWGPLSRALFLRVHMARIEGFELRGRVALAQAQQENDRAQRAERLASAARNVRRLEREATPWSRTLARLLQAGRLHLLGDEAGAAAALEEALRGFGEQGLALHAAVAGHRLGQLKCGRDGEALRAEACAWFERQRIKNPERVLATLAPGY